jgi:magnesium transporter
VSEETYRERGALGLPYEPATEVAAEHATARVPTATPDDTAEEIRRSLGGKEYESASDVAVCDDGRLLGLISIERLLRSRGDAKAREIMDADPPVVGPGIDQEAAAWKAVEHGESSLAVVDDSGKLVGLVPPRRLLAVFLREHEEDMARLGGFLRGTRAARSASQEPVALRFWHKVPWLLVGLAGAFLAADIVGAFEDDLEQNVTLAFFIPGIVYLADAVGTQTEALVIRGLSIGVPVRQVMRRELVTGVLVGAALGLVFLPIGIWRWGEQDVAVAVALSLMAACSVATLIAMALPALFQRLGRDPAFGSGPLATVVQDLLSIIIYFTIVSVIVD